MAMVLSVVGSITSSMPVAAASSASADSQASPHYAKPMAKMDSPASSLHLRNTKLDPRFVGGSSGAATGGSTSASTSTAPGTSSPPYAIPPSSYNGPRGYVEGKSVKVGAQWDATHRVWANPDGTLTMRIYSGPQNYKDGSGVWQPIDGTIQTSNDGSFHPAGLPVGLQFAASTAAADLVRVSDGRGNTVRFGAPAGSSGSARGVANGNELRYVDAYPGIDLEYVPSTDGVKELVVLESPAAAAAQPSFSFPMQLSSLHAAMRSDGGVDILDNAGTVNFTIPAPVMTDSNVDEKLGDGQHGPVSYSLSSRGSTTVLTVTPSASWLADPARVYPVYVDPSTFVPDRNPNDHLTWDAYVASAYPGSFQGDYYDTAISPNRWVVNVGVDPSGASGVNRTYAYYALDPLFGNSNHILSATWNGYSAWTYWAPGSTASSFNINAAGGYWNGTNITWNTQPACCEEGWIGHSDSYQQWGAIEIGSWVQAWINGSIGRNGVEIQGGNESSGTYWRRFSSVKNTDNSGSYLLVTYENWNVGYGFSNSDSDSGTTANAYRGPLPNTNANLTVTATNHSSTDSWPANGSFKLAYHVYDRSGNLLTWDGQRTEPPTTVASGSSYAFNASIGGLNPGSYTLQWDFVDDEPAGSWASQYAQPTAPFRIFVASPPTDQSPSSGSTVVAPPTLTVNPVNGAAVYRFQLGTDSTFATTLVSTAWQSSNSYTPSNQLTNGTTYYWRAIAADGADVSSQWSSTFSFVYSAHPVTVTKTILNAPASGFYSSGDPITFQVEVDNPDPVNATTVTVNDSMPAGVVATGAQVLVNNAICAAPITCVATGQTVSVSGVNVPAQTSSGPGQVFVQITAIVTGLERGCAILQNIASAVAPYGTIPSLPISFTVCNSGLGFEKWWSYAGHGVGPGVSAELNAANGNMVLQQNDLTPFQLHGHLALGLRRTYNSQDTAVATLPGSLGKGWTFNISEAGDLGDAGAGADGLDIPPVAQPFDAVLNGPPVTLIDQDGTRHTFAPNTITPVDVTPGTAVPGALNALAALVNSGGVLSLGSSSGHTHICVDQTYTAPAGVHLGLWRFVEAVNGCSNIAGAAHAVLGFATMRPDRMLSVFSWDGHLLDIRDGAGNEIRYTYANAPAAGLNLGNLMSISEPVSGRAFTFAYPASNPAGGGAEMDVTDPAGRVAKYKFDTPVLNSHLIEVQTLAKDGVTQLSDWKYVYGGCAGASLDQLCAVTDPNGNQSLFTYTSSFRNGGAVVGPARLASIFDRRKVTTQVNYFSAPDYTQVVQTNQEAIFQAIDASGRVGEIDAGDKSGSPMPHQTLYTWDAGGATCNSNAAVDNDLCSMTRPSGASTPNEVTSYTYGPNGELLDRRQALASGNLDTTFGYHTQQVLADGGVNCIDSTVAGSGSVNTGSASQCAAPGAGLTDTHVVYSLVDKTQSLTPRGNAAGAGYAPYLTAYKVDDNAAGAPGPAPASADICATPSSPTSNTGSLCETDAPTFDGTHASVTQYTYYPADGERHTMATPLAVYSAAGSVPQHYTYVYYPDTGTDATQTKDLSGTTSQGGWMKGVIDPNTNFVAFAYDAAGNVQRTWDRDATSKSGVALALFPGSGPSTYTETLYQPSTAAGTTSSPWLYLRSQRDPLGNTTTHKVDANGNQITITPPRGNQVNAPTFDITQTFDAGDNLLTRQMPAELAAMAKTTNTYDDYGNLVSTTDPDGNVRTEQYDAVNRLVASRWTRDSSSDPTPPASCTVSTASDTPIPANKVVCSTTTTYDNLDNRLQTQDGNHQNTNYTYDAVHRVISVVGPRMAGSSGTRTDTVYDQDGHVTAVCPPNLWASGATACPDGRYAQTRSYDVLGRLTGTTSYRESLDSSSTLTALTTSYAYDGDGNVLSTTDANGHVVSATYDLLDHKTSQTAHRGTTALVTNYTYDPAGNTTSVSAPGDSVGPRVTAYAFDADNRVTMTVAGSDSTSAALAGATDAAGSKNIRTSVVYDADGHVVARFDPRAYVPSTTSVTSPDASYMVRTDFDADGRATTQYVPRYGSSAVDPTNNVTQASQCSTAAPPSVTGVPVYPPGVGLCVTRAQYDAASNLTKVVLPTSNGQDNRFVAYSYTDDRLVSTVDSPDPAGGSPNARVQSTAVYDADGKPETVKDALGHSHSVGYYPDELVEFSSDALNHTTSYQYDANGNQTLVTDPMGIQTQTDYYADNARKDVVGAAQDTTGTYRNTTAYAYDNVGNVTTVYSPSAWLVHTATGSDANNPTGKPSSMTYTDDNLVASSLDPVVVTSATATLQQFRKTEYAYDLAGRKLSQHTYLVDGTSTAIAGADAGTQSFSYYPDDRQSVQTGRNGETITTQFDAAGNRTSIHDSTSGGSTITASYYLDGRERTVDDGAKTSQYAYDGSGMVLARDEATDGSNTGPTLTTTYGYGDAGQPASMQSSVVGNLSTTYTYDHAGRLTNESDPNGSMQGWSYNNDNTLNAHSVLQASTSLSPIANWAYAYNADSQQTEQTFSGASGSIATGAPGIDSSIHYYGYDPAGRLSSYEFGTGTAQTTKSITFDHNGNRLTYGGDSYSYNADNSIASFTPSVGAAETFSYYPFGGLKSDTCLTDAYDGFDRQTSAVLVTGNTCGANANAQYRYDGLDRQTGNAAVGRLDYDGLSNSVAIEAAQAGEIDYELAADGSHRALEQGTSNIQVLADDGFGNITTITGMPAALGVVCTARFDPYGNPINAQGTTATSRNACNTGSTINDFFYRGGRQDQVTGDYQFGSRTYDPTKSAFLTPDSYRGGSAAKNVSVGTDPLTENRYSYVNGDPINLVDPDGHCARYGDDTDSSGAAHMRFVDCGHYSEYVDYKQDLQSLRDAVVYRYKMDHIRQKYHDILALTDLLQNAPVLGQMERAGEWLQTQASNYRSWCSGNRLCSWWEDHAYDPAVGATGALDQVTGGTIGDLEEGLGGPLDRNSTAYKAGGIAANVALAASGVAGLARAGIDLAAARAAGSVLPEFAPAAEGGMFRLGEADATAGGLPRTMETVQSIAERGGVGLEGVDVRISRQAELEGRGLFGHTSPEGIITLYPDAFSSEEQLVQTLGHERMHVMQVNIFAPAMDSETLGAFERAASGTEADWLRYFRGDY